MAVRVELEGRLGSEPSVREVNGRDFVELSVAVSQGYWSKAEDKWVDQGAVWYRVHPTSRRAGEEARLLHKGDAVVVAGTQSVEEFTRRDGTNGYAIRVNADAIYVSRIPRRRTPSAFGIHEGLPAGHDRRGAFGLRGPGRPASHRPSGSSMAAVSRMAASAAALVEPYSVMV